MTCGERLTIRKMSWGEWRVYVPPTGRHAYDTDDSHLGPYGDSFWPTWAEARQFVVLVLATERERLAAA